MQQSSRKHHFIPAFYLRRWTGTDGRLSLWSKPGKQIVCYRKHPTATAWEKDLYTFQNLPVAVRHWFEDTFLKEVDDLAAQAIYMMEANRSTLLPEKLRSAWTRFVLAIRFRHPDVLREIKTIIKVGWEKQLAIPFVEGLDGDRASYEAALSSLDDETNGLVQMNILKAVMDNEKLGVGINNMYWEVFDLSQADFGLLRARFENHG